MSEKLETSEYLMGIWYLSALVGLAGSLLLIPMSLLHMIWVSNGYGMKMFLTAIVSFFSFFTLGIAGLKVDEEFEVID